jgi:hypothetical protein
MVLQVSTERQAQVELVALLVHQVHQEHQVSKVTKQDYNINFQLQPVVEILEVVY